MKKYLLLNILSLICSFGCLGQTENFLKLTKINWLKSYPSNTYIDSLFDREEYDKIIIPKEKTDTVYDRYELTASIENYYINFLDYQNSNPIIRYIINENTEVHYWNYFHKNGNIKRIGYTIGSVQNIGIWEEYFESGEMLSTIDYEVNRPSFNEVHELAKKKEWLKNELEFEYSQETEIWIIKDWTNKLNYTIERDKKIVITKFKTDYLDEDMTTH